MAKNVQWQLLPLNILSENGITEALCKDIKAIIKTHNMVETSDPCPCHWTESLDGLSQEKKDEWFNKEIKEQSGWTINVIDKEI